MVSSSRASTLDDECTHIRVAQCLGLHMCELHKCCCRVVVDTFSLCHLSCSFNVGKFTQNAALDDVIRRCFDTTGFPSQPEPAGLNHRNSKYPNGITIFWFNEGKSLVWDTMCSNTFSGSNLAGMAANLVCHHLQHREKSKITGA